MKKKIIAVTLSVLMVVSLAGCSKQLSNKYITITQYEGIEVTQVEAVEITDADVEQQIQSNLTAASTEKEVKDRAAKEGDTVNIDFKGSVDGVEFEGGSAEGASLELGSNSFIGAEGDYKGFEEQIVGHSIGESFDITVKFPADYQNAEMADKVAVFNVKLNSISIVTVPELTDKWVKENSKKSKTVEEYKKEIKKSVEDNNKKSTDATLQSAVMESLMDQIEVKEYPKKDLEEQRKLIDDYYQGMAKSYNMEFKDFATQYMQLTEEEYDKQAKEAAEKAVQRTLACDLIAKKKNLEPSKEEYDKQIKEFAESSGYEKVADFKKEVGEDVLKNTIRQQEVAKYLAEKCVQVEATEETTDAADTK